MVDDEYVDVQDIVDKISMEEEEADLHFSLYQDPAYWRNSAQQENFNAN